MSIVYLSGIAAIIVVFFAVRILRKPKYSRGKPRNTYTLYGRRRDRSKCIFHYTDDSTMKHLLDDVSRLRSTKLVFMRNGKTVKILR